MRESKIEVQPVTHSGDRAAATKRSKDPLKPLRYKLGEAAQLLNVHYETVRDLVTKGVFTVIAPKGRGVGKHIFLHPDEVEIYGLHGEDAVREHRIKKGRLTARK